MNWTVKKAKKKLGLKTNLELAEVLGCHNGTITLWNKNKDGNIPVKFHDNLLVNYNKIIQKNDENHRLQMSNKNSALAPTPVVNNNKKVNVFVINTNPRDIPLVVESLSK